jgi:hypothetical protein
MMAMGSVKMAPLTSAGVRTTLAFAYGQRLSDLPCSSSLLYTQRGSTQTFLQRHQDLGSLCFLGNMTGWVEDNPCKKGRDDVLLRSPLDRTFYQYVACAEQHYVAGDFEGPVPLAFPSASAPAS